MQNKLDTLKKSFLEKLQTLKNREEIQELHSTFLWKKWELKKILSWLKDLSIEEKKEFWQSSNTLKTFIIEEAIKKYVKKVLKTDE